MFEFHIYIYNIITSNFISKNQKKYSKNAGI